MFKTFFFVGLEMIVNDSFHLVDWKWPPWMAHLAGKGLKIAGIETEETVLSLLPPDVCQERHFGNHGCRFVALANHIIVSLPFWLNCLFLILCSFSSSAIYESGLAMVLCQRQVVQKALRSLWFQTPCEHTAVLSQVQAAKSILLSFASLIPVSRLWNWREMDGYHSR